MVLRAHGIPGRVRSAGALASVALQRRLAWLALGIAILASIPVVLWLARGTTFTVDELVWFATAPQLDLDEALQPHNGHLLLTTRVVYRVILEVLGSGYVPFLLLTVAANAALAVLLFAYMSRRVPPLVALAPILVLLYFGSAAGHVITGNGFTVLLALALGVGALLALERGDVRGDLAACTLLLLGVATYTVAVPFVAAAAVLVLFRDDRWRRAWIFAVPALAYAAWLIWARGAGDDPGGAVTISNLLLVPSWAFQSLSTTLAALVGLNYDFGGEASVSGGVGAMLALVALAGVLWRLHRGAAAPALWALLGALVVLWVMGALSADILRTPDNPRYIYPVAIGVLMVASWLVAGQPWARAAVLILFAVAGVSVLTNLALLRNSAAELRGADRIVRSEMAALEIAGERAVPQFDPGAATQGLSLLRYSWGVLAEREESPTELYLAAVDGYGPLGFSPAELRDAGEQSKERADEVLVAALGLELVNVPAPAGGCLEVEPGPDHGPRFQLPPGTEVVMQPRGEGGTVAVRRFADSTGVALGEIEAGQAARLALPDDAIPEGWQISGPGSPLLVCQADGPGG